MLLHSHFRTYRSITTAATRLQLPHTAFLLRSCTTSSTSVEEAITPIPSKRHKRVVVAMSGGIDSAATAYILKTAGFDCIGVFMKNWDSSDEEGKFVCSYSQDLADMREVCARLDMPAVEVAFVKEYWTEVFQPFLEAYQSGTETPNPDVSCNRVIKFKQLRDYAFETLGADFMATGHYVRLGYPAGGSLETPNYVSSSNQPVGSIMQSILDRAEQVPALLRGVDLTKDQSYFLSMTSAKQLRRVLFPLGALTKKEVRQLVQLPFEGLNVLKKRESMGVCFIGKRKFSDFLGQYISLTPGRFIDIDTGDVLGEHLGKESLTSGQGARIRGLDTRYFVVAPDCDTSAFRGRATQAGDVLVARGSDHRALFSESMCLDATEFAWVSGSCPNALHVEAGTVGELKCKARYNQAPEGCTVTRRQNRFVVSFNAGQRCLTAGQVCVLYEGDICLGGGIILPRENGVV